LEHADFLETNDIADRHLAKAIDYLGTTESIGERHRFVNLDYAGLEIRHLGSIYEGLLEYRLGYAETDLVSVRRSGTELWEPRENYRGKTPIERVPPERSVTRGDLYLETDRHERRVTGSYYTPDFVVKYIVDRTLSQIVSKRRGQARANDEKESDAVLSIRVCDPAMGSGHFLVEATEFLAEELLTAEEEDLARELIEVSEQDDLESAKREVVRRCIYGVDVNQLAVELAKVSLWLATISKSKPLSFLDHRLKHGNSLIGARLSDLKEYPKRSQKAKAVSRDSTLPEFISEIFIDKLLGKIHEVEKIADDRLEDVKRKERVFSEFKSLPEYGKTKAIANVHTSILFGSEVLPTKRREARQVYFDLVYALDYPSNWAPKVKTRWFQDAQRLAEEKRFFHWELEFPEVFFPNGKESVDSGFDAIVGNPPYVRIYRGQIPEEETAYYTSTYVAAHMKFDLYVLFMELGLGLLTKDGFFSMIVPDKWMNSPYGEPIRRKILRLQLTELADLRGLQVFREASVDNVIPVIKNSSADRASQVSILRPSQTSMDALTKKPHGTRSIETFRQLPHMQIRPEVTDEDLVLSKRIQAVSINLGRICYVNWGLRTGTAEKTRTMIGGRKKGSR
ncbi:MAG: Eco57I restriction-modification methylase domain-containing protein, partial [Candidatus Geothermarchaeales archaeon]